MACYKGLVTVQWYYVSVCVTKKKKKKKKKASRMFTDLVRDH